MNVLIIAAIFPIILNIITMWLFILYDTVTYWFSDMPYKDVYINIGNPYDEKPPAPPIKSDISNCINYQFRSSYLPQIDSRANIMDQIRGIP